MGEPYLKEWLNISLCLSKEIKDISEDFRNGYLFGEILHKHKLIPNFEFYKDSMNKSDISKNYQYLSKAFGDLNIKFSDTRRNDILNKKPGVSCQLLFKLKQVIDQKLLSKENLKMQKGPNELHKLYKELVFPNDNEKYYRDLLNRKAMKDQRKLLNPITRFLSQEGKFYTDIGKDIMKDNKYIDDKHKKVYENIKDLESSRGKLCLEKDEEGLKNWKNQMEIKKKFDNDQLKEKWKKTVFYRTATFNSFKKSGKSNRTEIIKFNENLSRLGLDVKDQNNTQRVKNNYMSPQIILKMYRDKIAEQEKSRKDKQKRIRKLLREEDKMLEIGNKKSKYKKIKIEAKDKNKTQYIEDGKSTKFMSLNEIQEEYDKKKKEYENVKELHKKEKKIITEDKKIIEKEDVPYKSMYDFFDKKLFFMRLDKLNTGYFKKKIEKRKHKDEKNLPDIKDIFEKILEITEESDNYLNGNNCELIEIPEWNHWMQLLKDNISIKEYKNEQLETNQEEKKSIDLLYENENEDSMILYKENEFFDYLNFMGNWDINIKEKILLNKDNNDSKISENKNKNNLNNFFKNINNNQVKNKDNPLELSLYKILGQDISYILNAGNCDITGLKENILLKMKNKEFEPGTQDINNVTLPTKYNKKGNIGEIIEFCINMKYDKKEKEMNNNNEIKIQRNSDTIKEETKKEIEPSEEQSIIKQDQNMDNINQNNNLLQSNDEIKLLEEIKENYTYDHIPIKLCFIGNIFSGRKTQSNLIHEKYPKIKIYNIESIIKEIIDTYNKINIPLEEQTAKGKNAKKMNIEQIKLENENIRKENAFQLSIIEPIMNNKEKEIKDIKDIIKEISDDRIIDLLLFYIKRDFPVKEKKEIEEEIKERAEKILNIDKELENMLNEEQNKKGKINIKEKERLIKEKEQIINESFIGFILNDFPKTLEQFKLFENKCTGYIEELDKPKEEKDMEKEELLYPLDKIYYPRNKLDNIKSIFDKYCIFDIEDEEILKRKNGRMVDETTGIIYHNEYNPPDEKDKKLIERLKPILEPSDEDLKKEIKKYFLDLIGIKKYIELFKNIYEVKDIKDKNEENETIINNVLNKIIKEYENKYSNKPQPRKITEKTKTIMLRELSKDKLDNEKIINTNENNNSNINSIKNNNIGRESSVGNLSSKPNKTEFILPILITPISRFNKRYNETKKRLSLSNLDIHFLNKWNSFLSEYKSSILRNFVNINNIKEIIIKETVKIQDEYIQFLNIASNKNEIIDRFTNKLAIFRSQFKDLKGHKLVIEEFHKDLTDLTNGIWDIINQKKQMAIDKREQIMNNGFFERQIKHFYENIENLIIQETKKFLLSVNIIKEFYYGLQSEILKSVILPFTSQIENIDINSIFKDTEDLKLILIKNGQLTFPKIDKMFYNCMKIIFYLDYAIRKVEDKLKGNLDDFKINNKEINNSGTLSVLSKSRLTKKKKKKNKDNSISEESKEIFNFIEESNTAIETEKYNYKYRLLCIKFYSVKALTNINIISTELFGILDGWIIDSVHYQNQMMNKLLERLSKIVDNASLKIIWDFELDKYTLMKIKKFEFMEPYMSFLEDDNEIDNREIYYSRYIPILTSLYHDISNFTLENEFIDKNTFIEVLLKKNISSIDLKNTPLYKLNYHLYQKLIDLMVIKNGNYIRKDLININHFFTILLLLPFPIINDESIKDIKEKNESKLISKNFLDENDFKNIEFWFEGNNILKNDDDEDINLNNIKKFLCLIFSKNGIINLQEFLEIISLKIITDNNEDFDKNKIKLYKDMFF